MKVRMDHFDGEGWDECDYGEPIELPDAVITEWRALKVRLEEIEKYFDERIPPLQREADAKVPPKPVSPIVDHWARMMLRQYMSETLTIRKIPFVDDDASD